MWDISIIISLSFPRLMDFSKEKKKSNANFMWARKKIRTRVEYSNFSASYTLKADDSSQWEYQKQERKTFIRSEAITMSCMIVIPENHSNDYVIS